MCLTNEVVDELHSVTSAMKAAQEQRAQWLAANTGDAVVADHDGCIMPPDSLHVTRAEAEQIFGQRIAAHEARLKELGWNRTVRVEPNPIDQPKRLDGSPG